MQCNYNKSKAFQGFMYLPSSGLVLYGDNEYKCVLDLYKENKVGSSWPPAWQPYKALALYFYIAFIKNPYWTYPIIVVPPFF